LRGVCAHCSSAPPPWAHPIGFGESGRDELGRIIYTTRIALIVAVLPTAVASGVGVAAGLFGGWIDSVLSRICEDQ
jgi:ABC-type dipeptide/oligopeptide/nickel transport system permease subunit